MEKQNRADRAGREGDLVLKVESLSKEFHCKGAVENKAVDEVSFEVHRAECVGLVGESGSGKSTIASLIMHFLAPSAGSIFLDGIDIGKCKGREGRELYRHVQAVFQSPEESFDPRRTLGEGVAEGLRNFGIGGGGVSEQVSNLFRRCGLPVEFMSRYPRQVSGGQCQRAAIARALAVEPSLLICDEATSALDMTVQKQMLSLLSDIRRQTDMSLLFICHDIALVQEICDYVLVLQDGRIVERGTTDEVLSHPQSPYTAQLIDAVL